MSVNDTELLLAAVTSFLAGVLCTLLLVWARPRNRVQENTR